MVRRGFLWLIGILYTCFLAGASVKLPYVLSDHMVLQRDMPVNIWGWANPGERIKVTFANQKKRARANDKGKWFITFPAMEAGGPYKIEISAENEIILKDVLIGDVWLCSGQSNMEWSLKRFPDCKTAIEQSDNPNIRVMDVPRRMALQAQDDVYETTWAAASPETVVDFSAVGYFFGKHLQEYLGIPIGLIGSNWGGTNIEAWMSKDCLSGFKSLPDLDTIPEKAHPNAYNTTLFNGMISPLLNFPVKGTIWYQGESNTKTNPQAYHHLFTSMIKDWRSRWGIPEMPFLYVQLANYKEKDEEPPVQSEWALLRESQAKTQQLENTGMAVIIDLGMADNIHPPNKNKVGERLFKLAQKVAYHDSLICSGPYFESMQIRGSSVSINFENKGSGLVSMNKYGYLQGFQVAGADKRFYWATALFDRDKVVVFSPHVKHPVAVRYAWGDNPEADLFNREGFPAVPFRTDNW